MLKHLLLLCGIASAQQSYINAPYNTTFQVPAGWVLGSPDTSFGAITLKVTRVGLQPVTMRATRTITSEAGYLAPSDEVFYRLYKLYNITNSTQAPVLTSIMDTTIGLLRYAGIVSKQIDQNLVVVEYAVSNQNYMHTFIYSTSLTDYTTNNQLYVDPWNSFLFISLNGPAAKISAMNANSQSFSQKLIFDILGRSQGNEIRIQHEKTPLMYLPQK